MICGTLLSGQQGLKLYQPLLIVEMERLTIADITGAKIPPAFPIVEHSPIVKPREAVGNTSAVITLTVTSCIEMKNLPASEKPTISQ